MNRLRVLIEIDGQIAVDMTEHVESATVTTSRDILDTGTSPGGWVLRGPSGEHHIHLDYRVAHLASPIVSEAPTA